MKRICWLLLTLWAVAAVQAKDSMIETTERAGRLYVAASDLSKDADIAIKSLPGQKPMVACSRDRCAVVSGCLRSGDEILVPVMELTEALGAKARFDEKRQRVGFEFPSRAESALAGHARVGQLAPDFRLVKLDGGAVSLSDFRGKRVLINSWASW